jgi:hypothetical protein
VEFQKRGLPHAHIAVIIHPDDSWQQLHDIDNFVTAELPRDYRTETDPEKQQTLKKLEELVLKHMIHGPCGPNSRSKCMIFFFKFLQIYFLTIFTDCPCMYKHGSRMPHCQKKFPKKFCAETSCPDVHFAGYPTYRRRSVEQGGRQIIIDDVTIDNSWVVPYNPVLLLEFQCHINVEICAGPMVVKYLYKYFTKGGDRALAKETPQRNNPSNDNQQSDFNVEIRDEIRDFIDYKSTGSTEAFWRLFNFNLNGMYPHVQRLPVHLEDEQLVFVSEGDNFRQALRNESFGKTQLTEFFAFNADNPSTSVAYISFPESHTWDPKTKKWKTRKRRFDTIGRIFSVSPKENELFYLRMLLNSLHSSGKTSFTDLRTINGIRYNSYREAAAHLGFTNDDFEWFACMRDAASSKMPTAMRQLLFIILTFNEVENPKNLLDSFILELAEDFLFSVKNITDDINRTDLARVFVLIELEKLLLPQDLSLKNFGLPEPTDQERKNILELTNTAAQEKHSILLREQLTFNRIEYANLVSAVTISSTGDGVLTNSQKIAYDAIL